MSSTPVEIGTLIVVILKARNLPNKRHIGKQAPYCLVEFNNDKRRTKAIRRGGQHPEWDEEIRFTLFEDTDDNSRSSGDGTPPPPPPKTSSVNSTDKKIKGGKSMWVACYADDQREPELIGETTVDLTEALTKGETDEWFTILAKDKYCGEVYLELTFWSNDKPPEKHVSPQPLTTQTNYGGPGSFIPTREGSGSENGRYQADTPSRRESSSSTLPTMGTFPQAIPASGSLAGVDLYIPPYERRERYTRRRQPDIGYITNGMAELGVGAPRRRESFPPINGESARMSAAYISTPNIPPPNNPVYEDYLPTSSMSSLPSDSSLRSYDSFSSHQSSIGSGHFISSITQEDAYGAAQINSVNARFNPPWSHVDSVQRYYDPETVQSPTTPAPHHFHNSRPYQDLPSGISPAGLNTDHSGLAYSDGPPIQGQYLSQPVPPPPSLSAPPGNSYHHRPPLNAMPAPGSAPILPLSYVHATSSYGSYPGASPPRVHTPVQPQTPPSVGGGRRLPLPDPYNQSPLSHQSSINSSPSPAGQISYNYCHNPESSFPQPQEQRPTAFFTPPPPPPPLPTSSFSSPTPAPRPATSFDFSHVPPPPPPPALPSSRQSVASVPPPPPLLNMHHANIAQHPSYPGPPPPLPPQSYDY